MRQQSSTKSPPWPLRVVVGVSSGTLLLSFIVCVLFQQRPEFVVVPVDEKISFDRVKNSVSIELCQASVFCSSRARALCADIIMADKVAPFKSENGGRRSMPTNWAIYVIFIHSKIKAAADRIHTSCREFCFDDTCLVYSPRAAFEALIAYDAAIAAGQYGQLRAVRISRILQGLANILTSETVLNGTLRAALPSAPFAAAEAPMPGLLVVGVPVSIPEFV